MIVDWWVTLFSTAVRTVLAVTSLGLAAAACLATGVRPLFSALGWKRAAASADEHVPELEERWTTVAAFADRVRRHALSMVSEDSIVSPVLSGADDMARFLEIAPGCYYLLGAATEEHGVQGHHQGRFAIDDRSLALGLELSLRVIDEYLGE